MKTTRRTVFEILTLRKQTVGFAESCTGGLLSAQFAEEPGISAVLKGAVVAYHRSIKANLLHVPWHLLQTMGEVSEPVAQQMAKGACCCLGSDWAVAVTGVAGPGGGSPDKPVGTVCFAVVGPGFEETRRVQFAATERLKIQQAAVSYGMEFLLAGLTGNTQAPPRL